jgi:hypothetical protein
MFHGQVIVSTVSHNGFDPSTKESVFITAASNEDQQISISWVWGWFASVNAITSSIRAGNSDSTSPSDP